MLNVQKIVDVINKLGYKTFTYDYNIYNEYINGCYQWWKGNVPSFHTVKQYNGKYEVTVKKAELHMGKRISEDIASLVANENLVIGIESEAEKLFILGTDEMQGVLGKNDFWSAFNKCIELVAGLGTGAVEIVAENIMKMDDKILVSPDSNIKIVTHKAQDIIALSWDSNKKVKEVCFVDTYKINTRDYVELRLHIIGEDGNYKIINKKYEVFNGDISQEVLNTEGIVEEFNTGSNIPWFTVIKMPQLNSYDVDSPMGASAYGDAIDELKAIDDAFNTLCGEFRYSGKKVFYNKSLLNRDNKGNVIVPDDANKEIFYYTGDDNAVTDDNNPIHEFNPTIRTQEISEGIELLLDILSFKVGLGHGYYKFSNGTVTKTATEVLSSKSDLWRNVCKMQLCIEKNILEIIKGILYVSNYVTGTNFNVDTKVKVDFDASLIEDKQSEKAFDLELVKNNLITISEFRKKWLPELGEKKEDDQQKDIELNM